MKNFEFVMPVDGDDEHDEQLTEARLQPLAPGHLRNRNHKEEGARYLVEGKMWEYRNGLWEEVEEYTAKKTDDGKWYVATGESQTDDEDSEFVLARRMVFAAARVISESRTLRYWNDLRHERSEVALAYVQSQKSIVNGRVTFTGATGGDFDERFETIQEWARFAEDHADFRIGEDSAIPGDLAEYYEFNYERYGNALESDYEIIGLSGGQSLILRDY